MKTNFNIGDYICPKIDPNKIYKITSITSFAPNQNDQDIIDARTKDGEREKFQISEVQFCDIKDVDESIFMDL